MSELDIWEIYDKVEKEGMTFKQIAVEIIEKRKAEAMAKQVARAHKKAKQKKHNEKH